MERRRYEEFALPAVEPQRLVLLHDRPGGLLNGMDHKIRDTVALSSRQSTCL